MANVYKSKPLTPGEVDCEARRRGRKIKVTFLTVKNLKPSKRIVVKQEVYRNPYPKYNLLYFKKALSQIYALPLLTKLSKF